MPAVPCPSCLEATRDAARLCRPIEARCDAVREALLGVARALAVEARLAYARCAACGGVRGLRLVHLQATTPGQGDGSLWLGTLAQIADFYRVAVDLTTASRDLARFYQRFGFAECPRYGFPGMVRRPRAAASAPEGAR